MKVNYKGFEINVKREKSLGGWNMLYYYVMKKDSGFMLIDNFSDSDETVRDQIKYLKEAVDRYLENPENWKYEI